MTVIQLIIFKFSEFGYDNILVDKILVVLTSKCLARPEEEKMETFRLFVESYIQWEYYLHNEK